MYLVLFWVSRLPGLFYFILFFVKREKNRGRRKRVAKYRMEFGKMKGRKGGYT